MAALRAALILAGFVLFTLALTPAQLIALKVSRRWAAQLPHWYHRRVCRLLGVRLHVEGEAVRGAPLLLAANHVSWLDIFVLSALAPVSFVAKKEVADWPGAGTLARLQRTIFLDRSRRADVADAAVAIEARLLAGDAIALFPEGTSSDGSRVLPFRTSLFAAAKPPKPSARTRPEMHSVQVQSVALAYTRLHGLPVMRMDRPRIGWYGDMDMPGHVWNLLKAGPIDVRVRFGAPAPLNRFSSRKDLALSLENEVRTNLIQMLRERPAGKVMPPTAPLPQNKSRL